MSWVPSQYKDHLTSIGIHMLKIRRSHDRLIFNMGIPIHGKDGLYIETGPRFCKEPRHQQPQYWPSSPRILQSQHLKAQHSNSSGLFQYELFQYEILNSKYEIKSSQYLIGTYGPLTRYPTFLWGPSQYIDDVCLYIEMGPGLLYVNSSTEP